MHLSTSRVLLLFWRAVRLKCPNCGGGPLFHCWVKPRAHCPSCGLLLERGEDGYQVAPFVFFPFSKTLFLAFDLLFRPATTDELR